jgi:hypothetical protein
MGIKIFSLQGLCMNPYRGILAQIDKPPPAAGAGSPFVFPHLVLALEG